MGINLGIIDLLLALMIRQAPVYQTKSGWRLIHHSLLVASVLFFISPFIPLPIVTLVNIPVHSLLWLLVFLLPPLIRRIGVSFVATPAKPPHTTNSSRSTGSRSTSSTRSTSSRSNYSRPARKPTADQNSEKDSSDKSDDTSQESSENKPRRRPYRRRPSGTRRRV